jgi:putative membrane protein
MTGEAADRFSPMVARPADADSRARTHLANERTFLAWLRTGLSLVAVGLAAAGFLPVDLVPGFRYVTLFAVFLVLIGTAAAVYGANRYVVAYRQIELGAYRPVIGPIVAFAIVVGVLGLMAIPVAIYLR